MKGWWYRALAQLLGPWQGAEWEHTSSDDDTSTHQAAGAVVLTVTCEAVVVSAAWAGAGKEAVSGEGVRGAAAAAGCAACPLGDLADEAGAAWAAAPLPGETAVRTGGRFAGMTTGAPSPAAAAWRHHASAAKHFGRTSCTQPKHASTDCRR